VEDLSTGSFTSANRELNHSQNTNAANSWSLVSVLKYWSKAVSVGDVIHWIFYFHKPLNSKNLGKLKTWGEGQGGWRKQRLSCLWVWTLLLIECVMHWQQGGLNGLLVPLAARGRNCLLQHMEVSVQSLAFFTRIQIYYWRENIPEKANEFQGYGEGTINHKCTPGLLWGYVSYPNKN